MATQHQHALITGATSGVGLELAKLFANDHYNLVFVARAQAERDRTASELKQAGIGGLTIAKNLSQRQASFAWPGACMPTTC